MILRNMDGKVLIIFACTMLATSAWSIPYYPMQRVPLRVTRYAPSPPHHFRPLPQQQLPQLSVHPIRVAAEDEKWERPKRDHRDYDDHDHDSHHKDTRGVTGPVHTFVKTDKNANYKWGVRHHVGNKYAS